MAIVNDSRKTGLQTLAASATGATSVSWTHTLGAGLSDVMLVVSLAHDSTGNAASVTWDDGGTPVALSRKGFVLQGFAVAEIHYLVNPVVTGARTVKASWSGSQQGQGGSASYSGVLEFNPASPQTSVGLSGTNPSLSVTTTTGEVVIDCAVQDLTTTGDTPAKGGSQTYIAAGVNAGATNTIESGHSEQAGSGTAVTMSWTMKPSGGAWGSVGVSLTPVPDYVSQYRRNSRTQYGRAFRG